MGGSKENSTKKMARVLQQNKGRFYSQIWQELFINGDSQNDSINLALKFYERRKQNG